MKNKLHHFFSENDFDFQEPHAGHLDRFERKLNQKKQPTQTSWKWLSVAASIVLLIGFWFGNSHQRQQIDLADISPKMEEVQNYFISTIKQELVSVESNRSLETEAVIEEALESLEKLEESYAFFILELSKKGNENKIIQAMIENYQQRLEILENVLMQIKLIKTLQTVNDEIFI